MHHQWLSSNMWDNGITESQIWCPTIPFFSEKFIGKKSQFYKPISLPSNFTHVCMEIGYLMCEVLACRPAGLQLSTRF